MKGRSEPALVALTAVAMGIAAYLAWSKLTGQRVFTLPFTHSAAKA